jgi:hypothetical protein
MIPGWRLDCWMHSDGVFWTCIYCTDLELRYLLDITASVCIDTRWENCQLIPFSFVHKKTRRN